MKVWYSLHFSSRMELGSYLLMGIILSICSFRCSGGRWCMNKTLIWDLESSAYLSRQYCSQLTVRFSIISTFYFLVLHPAFCNKRHLKKAACSGRQTHVRIVISHALVTHTHTQCKHAFLFLGGVKGRKEAQPELILCTLQPFFVFLSDWKALSSLGGRCIGRKELSEKRSAAGRKQNWLLLHSSSPFRSSFFFLPQVKASKHN